MDKGIAAFASVAADLNVDDERTFEILGEIEQAAKEVLETPEGQMYAKAMECKAAGNLEEYHKILDQIIGDLTKEYHRSTGY